ncbi:MAG: NAD-dependent epimerase/dehydratase family protein [Candidatus Hydrogenedentota bacterium]
MKILITGCAGFIGSHIAKKAIKEGYRVTGIDCFLDNYDISFKRLNIQELLRNKRFIFKEKNVLNLTNKDLADIDYIFHCSALPGVRTSWGKHFKDYVENNILATQHILELMKDKKNIIRLIFTSSSSIYGETKELPVKETSNKEPFSPYGVTKFAAERLIQSYINNFGVDVVILRLFSVYGPGQRQDMAFHKMIKALLEGKEFVIFGKGSKTRDFTYIDDVVNANFLCFKRAKSGDIFNIGGGNRISLIKVIHILEKISQRKIRLKYDINCPGDVSHTYADISLAKERLGYNPAVSIEQGLEAEYEWLKEILFR